MSTDNHMDEWREYPPNHTVYPYSRKFWQKRLFIDSDDNRIAAEVVQYDSMGIPGTEVYELNIQIPASLSLLDGKTINVQVFTYTELNFDDIERDARNLLTRLLPIAGKVERKA